MEPFPSSSTGLPWISIDVEGNGSVSMHVNVQHLQDFPKFLHFLLREKIGFDTGFVKVIVTDAEEGTSLENLCLYAQKHFCASQKQAFQEVASGNVVQQVFHHGSETHHVYKLSEKLANPKQFQSFVYAATDPASYSTSSKCCEEAMSTSLDNLHSHLWQQIRDRSLPSYILQPALSRASFLNLLKMGAANQRTFHPYSVMEADIPVLEDTVHTSPLRGRKRGAQPKSILYCPGIPLKEEKFSVCRGFSLSNLGTILDLCGSDIPGVTSPFMYFGHPHSTFPWHVEDMGLFSINYLHYGAPCLWNFVSPKDYSIFAKSMRFMPLDPGDTGCGFALVHKFLLADRTYLQSIGINVHSTLQKQHELIITYPYAAHSGHRLGLSISQAVNFADPFWVEVGVLAPPCACELSQVNFTNFDMKRVLACSRRDLLQMYLAKDFIGLAKKLANHEFVKLLKLVPEHLCSLLVDDPKVNVRNVEGDIPPSLSSVLEARKDTTQDQSMESFNGSFEPPQFKGARYVLQCPACDKTYVGGRGRLKRLLHHVTEKHPDRPDLELQVKHLNPSKTLKKFTTCPVCKEPRSGDLFHLKQHMKKKHPGYLPHDI